MIIDIILGAVIVLQSILHYSERKDLYNRIMSRSLDDYKGKPQHIITAHRRRLDEWRKKDGESE